MTRYIDLRVYERAHDVIEFDQRKIEYALIYSEVGGKPIDRTEYIGPNPGSENYTFNMNLKRKYAETISEIGDIVIELCSRSGPGLIWNQQCNDPNPDSTPYWWALTPTEEYVFERPWTHEELTTLRGYVFEAQKEKKEKKIKL